MNIILKKIHFLTKSNDVFYVHIDTLYAFGLLHFNLQMQHPGVFLTYFKRTSDSCGEITLTCSRKV